MFHLKNSHFKITLQLSSAAGVAALLLSAMPAFAATQGSLANRSSGSAYISVSKPITAEVHGIRDAILERSHTSSVQNICIYSSTGSYQITAEGSGNRGAFTVENNGHKLAYTLNLQTVGKVLNLSSAKVARLVSSNTGGKNTQSCASANLTVQLPQASLAAARDVHYGGVLTMVVAPI